MNPGGVTEEAGKAASSAIDALKSTPALLSVVIFNVLFMAIIAWTTHESGQRWERLVTTALQSCAPAPKP